MGVDKSLLLVDGEPISVRLGRLLGEVAARLSRWDGATAACPPCARSRRDRAR